MAVDHGKIKADFLDFMKAVRLSKASKASNTILRIMYIMLNRVYVFICPCHVLRARLRLKAMFLRYLRL